MKHLAAFLLLLAFAGVVGAEEKVVVPVGRQTPIGLCIFTKIDGLSGAGCFLTAGLPVTAALVREFVLGYVSSFSDYYSASCTDVNGNPLDVKNPALKDCAKGQFLNNNVTKIAFPEFGDVVTKDTPAIAVCGSTIDAQFDFNAAMTSGQGKCYDAMIVKMRWSESLED